MKNDKRKANIEKYREVLGAIGRANHLKGADSGHEIDLGVAYDMLLNASKTIRKLDGVPIGFDWEEFKKDIE